MVTSTVHSSITVRKSQSWRQAQRPARLQSHSEETWSLRLPCDLAGLIVEHRGRGNVDLIAIVEGQALDADALVDDAVDAIGILDDPAVVLITNACVQTRDTLVGHPHIVAVSAPNGDQRFVKPTLTHDFAIEFDEDASLFHRALRYLGLWLPAWLIYSASTHRWRHHPGRHFLEGRAQDRFIASSLSAVAILLGEKISEDAL